MNKVKCIGIIAEDYSDFEAAKIIIERIIQNNNISFKQFLGNGCGRIKKKALDYATKLKERKCDLIILIHDLDNNKYDDLYQELNKKIQKATDPKLLICIPIQELEAWFLGDPDGIKKTFNLKRRPKFKGDPETINSPKKKLGDQIYLCSNKSIIFLNTKHNALIAKNISIENIKKRCSSFEQLHSFIKKYKYR